jgi:glucokinase
MHDALVIGVDAGGTKVAALAVDVTRGAIIGRRVVGTPAQDADASVRTIVAAAGAVLAEHPGALAVGVGAAGMVDGAGVMRFAPNLAWRDVPLAERIANAVGLPTVVENDGNAAAWGEFRFGAGRGFADMVLVTVGTGIGGGIVAGGELVRGANGFAAEIGHLIVEPGGPVCGCGNRGCWEQVASGRAIDRLGRQFAREHPGSAMTALAGGDPEKVTGPVVSAAARAGDPGAVWVLAEVGRRLGEGIAGLINILDPEVVVIGGGAMQAGDPLLEPARVACGRAVEGRGHRPDVRLLAASMGNDAGAVGAADLAYRRAVLQSEARV